MAIAGECATDFLTTFLELFNFKKYNIGCPLKEDGLQCIRLEQDN